MSREPFETANENLKKYWGFSSFRPGQSTVIRAALEGRDSVVLFPTGGGKSICYQVPATVFGGLTLVISPLVALMQDQVEQLTRAGVRATFINSTISSFEVEQRLINARNGMYKLLYLAPERLESILWKQIGPDLEISLIAVDEAHCISQWGHDFRPCYRSIRTGLEGLAPGACWMALTATATPEVQKDIIRNLQLDNPVIVARGFERPNLQWWVSHSERKNTRLLKAVKQGVKKGSGILYTGTRNGCEELAETLSHHGITSKAYHAGLSGEERNAIQRGWVEGQFPVVVATNAFGMGIDKGDCRFVIHVEMPYTVEAYYQEAGRAGRDGADGYPMLFYRDADYQRARARLLRSYPDLESLRTLYDALCDDLNLAVGSRLEEPEVISIESVATRASLPLPMVEPAIRVLERLQVAEILTHSEPRLGLRFTVSEEVLRETIDGMSPAKAEFLDLLFRQYGPNSFRKLHYLDISYLTGKLGVNRTRLINAVVVYAEQDRLVEYRLLDREPLLRLLEPRMHSLPATRNDVEHYRDVLLKKLEYMKGYAETEECRERYLRRYFGETKTGRCGHCDNCLRSDEDPDGVPDLRSIKELLQEPKSYRELSGLLNWKGDRLKRVLRFLIREKRVEKSDHPTNSYRWIRPR